MRKVKSNKINDVKTKTTQLKTIPTKRNVAFEWPGKIAVDSHTTLGYIGKNASVFS